MFGLAALAFLVTLAEAYVGAAFAAAVRDKRGWRAVLLAGAFEFLLCVDVWLLADNPYWVAVPIVLAAMLGTWLALRNPRSPGPG